MKEEKSFGTLLGKASLLIPLMLLTACATSGIVTNEANDSALCTELKEPIDSLADTLLDFQGNTPAEVINGGTRVIRGFDAGCKP